MKRLKTVKIDRDIVITGPNRCPLKTGPKRPDPQVFYGTGTVGDKDGRFTGAGLFSQGTMPWGSCPMIKTADDHQAERAYHGADQ
ncbi:hypothetical protein CUJ86_02165 [Methanofollis fontis]|uniref:Uncharacterized protein n=1 Tax=Methanofollis fontis TaxID=2052832 RepID=A0A483CZ29_9EURY|nr:hypothetical protein CUJ86_02165 [Methanofollis fontis]